MNMEQKIINTLRGLSADAVQKANSGHPGLPLGAAPMAYTLWAKGMKHNPHNSKWHNRDRFILSAGHGSALLYSLLHLFDYGLTMDDLKDFRQWGSRTAGHPEYGHTVGVEATTGPLGAGFAMAVGMAMGEAHLAAKYNKEFKPVDHYTFALCGDGCLMEGISAEAASLAGTLELGKLIVLYDSNNITIEGNTDIAFTEDVAKRFEAYHWQVLRVEDGNDIEAIAAAIEEAKKDLSKPSLIEIRTVIGYGAETLQGTADVHGAPLGKDNVKAMKEYLGLPAEEHFYVEDGIYEYMQEFVKKGEQAEKEWQAEWAKYEQAHPELAKELLARLEGNFDLAYMDTEEFWTFAEKPNATRNLSGEVIQRIAQNTPALFGGSADLAPSTKTFMNGLGSFSKQDYSGRNIHFGVRELAMTAMLNGLELHGGFKSYGATFFVFSDYMKPMIRLAALMNIAPVYVLTHDSIGVGEDGPTHQPIEQLASLRSMPNVITFRPADAKETAAAWYTAIHSKQTPVAIVLTRQNLPYYQGSGKEALKGGYIISDCEKQTPDVLLMASGSEVEQMVGAQAKLKEEGIAARVISMPSFELFEKQSEEYKQSVMPKEVTARLAMEAGRRFGWDRYLGFDGQMISMETFGASGPADIAFKEFGFTVENAVSKVKEMLK